MYITDKTEFPIITISYKSTDKQSVEDVLAKFDALLAKRQKFLFISEGSFDETENEQDYESRKKIVTWVKANRQTLSKYILALIHLEQDSEQRVKMEHFSKMYITFSGYPMHIVSHQNELDRLVTQLLNLNYDCQKLN